MSHPHIRTDRLAHIFQQFPQKHIWVVGDVMLDEYCEGGIERISPEAPVQVVSVADEYMRLGGAANVAQAIVALGCRATLGGIIGDDEAGQKLRATAKRMGLGLDQQKLLVDPKRQTTRKLRVVSQHQQLMRLDWESRTPIDATLGQQLFTAMQESGPPEAIVLSDYAKGVLTEEVIQLFAAEAKRLGVALLVDPKHADFKRYRGATIIKPNWKEFCQAIQHLDTANREPGTANQDPDMHDDTQIAAIAAEMCAQAQLEHILITLGDQGMVLYGPNCGLQRFTALAHDVYDVTGAGDSVNATMACMMAVERDPLLASHLANHAASLSVTKLGTMPVHTEELLASLAVRPSEKTYDTAELHANLKWWRLRNKSIVFTNGCFDLLHVGHVSLLQQAADCGDILIVGLNSDESIRRLKGPERPLIPQRERAMLLAALQFVDGVVIFDEDTPQRIIEQIQPDVLVKGADYRIDQVVGREVVEARGGKVVLVSLVENKSTSALVNAIRQAPSE